MATDKPARKALQVQKEAGPKPDVQNKPESGLLMATDKPAIKAVQVQKEAGPKPDVQDKPESGLLMATDKPAIKAVQVQKEEETKREVQDKPKSGSAKKCFYLKDKKDRSFIEKCLFALFCCWICDACI